MINAMGMSSYASRDWRIGPSDSMPLREPWHMTDSRLDAVERFYDFHPINAKQILDAVVARGIAPDAITEAVLQ
jgi:hypothetical protein